MIKKFKLFLIFTALMIIVPTKVLGASDKSHILTIENFTINNNSINLDGYAFISHVDNVGGDGGNLKNYVMVYTGDWNSNWNDPGKCVGASNCYVSTNLNGNPKAADDVDRSFFYARCTQTGCHYRSSYMSQFSSNLSDDKCSGSISVKNESGKTITDSECLYERVGFSQQLDLEKINAKLGDKVVKFRIVTVNKDYEKGVLSSGFAIYSGICEVNGVACNTNSTFETGLYRLNFSGVTDIVTFDAVNAQPYDKVFNKKFYEFFKPSNTLTDKSSTSRDDRNYTVLNWVGIREQTKSLTYDKNGNIIGEKTYGYNYKDSFFKLDSVIKGDDVYPAGYITDGEEVDYYSPGNWITFTGQLSLELKKLSRDIDCSDISDFANTPLEIDDLGCKSKNSGQINECREIDNISTEIYVKVPSSYNSSSCSSGVTSISGANYIEISLKTNVLINQGGLINLKPMLNSGTVRAGKGFEFQTYELPGVSSTIMVSPVNYVSLLTWVFAKWKYGENVPYYSYSTKYGGGASTCSSVNAYDLFDSYTGNSYYYLKPDGSISSAMSLTEASFNAVDSYVQKRLYKIKSLAGAESLETDAAKSAESIFNNNIKMVSCNSNYSGVGCSETGSLVDVKGSWDLVAASVNFRSVKFKNTTGSEVIGYTAGTASGYAKAGKASWYVFTYRLPKAYISLADKNDGYNYGDIAYENKSSNSKFLYLGNKYFISYKYSNIFNYNGFDWPFNLKDSNPSLVVDMNDWRIKGTCGINVSDGYYKTDDGSGGTSCSGSSCKTILLYKYRTISVKNPFPKFGASPSSSVGIALNWKDWYWQWNASDEGSERVVSKNRLQNTYNKVLYSVSFKKNASSLDINDIVNCGNSGGMCGESYGELSKFSPSGSSPFVTTYFNTSNSGGSYCGLGIFSSTCDLY